MILLEPLRDVGGQISPCLGLSNADLGAKLV